MILFIFAKSIDKRSDFGILKPTIVGQPRVNKPCDLTHDNK